MKIHIYSKETDIEEIEGQGALNFLAIDDLPVVKEGETVDPNSVIQLPFAGDKPVFPEMTLSATDPFLKSIQASHKKWVVITDGNGEPKATLNSGSFVQAALFGGAPLNPLHYCHRPIIVKDERATLGEVIPTLNVQPQRSDDDVIDKDIILFWGSQKRIITGSDILGRLMRGIVQNQSTNFKKINPIAA